MTIQTDIHAQLLGHLEKNNLVDFLSAFHSLSSPSEKAAYLVHDDFKLYTHARSNLIDNHFTQLIIPLHQEIIHHSCSGLSSAIKSNDFASFKSCFSAIPSHERFTVLLNKYESNNLVYLALSSFTEDNFLEIVKKLPPILSKIETDIYEPPLGLSPLPSHSPHFDNARELVRQINAFSMNNRNSSVSKILAHVYLNYPPELLTDREFVRIALSLDSKAFIDFVENVPTMSIFETFFYDDPDAGYSLIQILQRHGADAVCSILSNIPRAYALRAQEKLLSVIGGQTLHARLEAVSGSHHESISVILNFTGNKTSPIQPIYHHNYSDNDSDPDDDDDDDLLVLPKKLSARLDSSFPQDSPEPTEDEIFQAEIRGLDDMTLQASLRKDYHSLSISKSVIILKEMSPRARFSILTGNFHGECMLEKFAKSVGNDLLAFLQLMSCFEEDEHHKIYMHPVKYAVTQGATSSSAANAAFGILSAAASYMPVFAEKAQKTANTYQGGQDINELLLSRLIRANPQLIQLLPDMLIACAPEHVSHILRTPDSNGDTLFLKLFQLKDLELILRTLARAAFETKDVQKLVNPESLNLVKLRDAFKDQPDNHARVGFITLLGIYNYICVRGTEPGTETYQQSKTEFLAMLKVLQAHRNDHTITQMLKKYCQENPVRKAYSVHLAVTKIELGTNRHLVARNKVELLTSTELQMGLASFAKFILAKMSNLRSVDPVSLDSNINKILNRSEQSPSSASSHRTSASCRA